MSELQLRVITGFFFGIAMISLSWAPDYIVQMFFGIILVLAGLELSKMANVVQGVSVDSFYLVSSLLLFYITLCSIHYFEIQYSLCLGLIVAFFILVLYELWRDSGNALLNIAVFTLSVFYVLVPFFLTAQLVLFSSDLNLNFPLLIGLLILIWTNDTMAYFTGKFFGKTPIFKRISPKKTIEGTLGGIVFSLVSAYIIYLLTDDFSLIFWMISAVVVVPMSIFGDFFESLLKRAVNFKDSGSILPGHGGVLDRFDSLMFSVPIFYFWVILYLEILQP